MKNFFLIFSIISVLLSSACSSIVKKPEIEQVKTAAIVSIFANSRIPEAQGSEILQGWSSELKQEVANNFLNEYETGFTNKLGWKMLPVSSLLTSKEYKDLFRPETKSKNESFKKLGSLINKMSDMSDSANYFAPADMYPLDISHGRLKIRSGLVSKQQKIGPLLSNMAKTLSADAVIVVHIDFCYEPTTLSIQGLKKSRISAASSIHAVDKHGNTIINMGELKSCGKQKNRAASNTSLGLSSGILAGALQDQSELLKAFTEALKENTSLTMQQVKSAMK
ncbi:MAG: hypothetical protein R3240_05520 [Gammaproteobacteria bacterium]|nr:hypothetical protein [Gammaproteobacteria bacterium]